MKARLKLGNIEIIWLNGGSFELDGGAMFGVVPKILWKKKYPCDEDNFIPIAAWPMLIKTPEQNLLIETGLGNKLTDKQKKIFRIKNDWDIISDLRELGIKREDIGTVILTHYDFDHAGGVIMQDEKGELSLTFPNAEHILQAREWADVLSPNLRSENTFWPVNNELLRNSANLKLIEEDYKVQKGVDLFFSGAHNRGHQVVRIESQGEVAYHLGDLLPTHTHFNPLWIMAYDNYPLEVIEQKELFEGKALKENAWFLLYHDPFMPACKFDADGNVTEKVSVEG
ncbi:MAG: MBL fold metallo-hydrolase [Nitrospiraceae bacterium]|nr:MAG: MBL fold metallo-hydrolase [Nitrospiraceae bacterium]